MSGNDTLKLLTLFTRIVEMETQLIEYKSSWRDEWLEWICGYANAQGGTLYIGKDDDGKVIGVKQPKKLLEDIPNKVSSTMGIVPDVNYLEEDGKGYIQIVVVPSSIPVSYRGKYYYRSGATSKELNGNALQDLLLKRMGLTWDAQPIDASLDEIDPEAIKYFIKRGIGAKRIPESARNDSIETILRTRNLIGEDGRLKLAAVLLFGKNPQKYCLTSRTKIGMFGQGYSDLDIQDLIEGNLIQMPDKVINVLDAKYLVRPIHYEGIQRIEPLEIPVDALREIICNAIIHRDYRGSDIMIRVFKNRLEIWNLGNLPPEVQIDKLWEKHSSVLRNPLIASAFYYAGFIESWGRGYEKIQNAFEADGLKLPTFEAYSGGFEVVIQREAYLKTTGLENLYDTKNDKVGAEDGAVQLTERQMDILDLIRGVGAENGAEKQALKTHDMVVRLGLSRRTIQREIDFLTKRGFIVRVGGDKDGHWEVVK